MVLAYFLFDSELYPGSSLYNVSQNDDHMSRWNMVDLWIGDELSTRDRFLQCHVFIFDSYHSITAIIWSKYEIMYFVNFAISDTPILKDESLCQLYLLTSEKNSTPSRQQIGSEKTELLTHEFLREQWNNNLGNTLSIVTWKCCMKVKHLLWLHVRSTSLYLCLFREQNLILLPHYVSSAKAHSLCK